MVLELHVWGPAFELPSIDAECLATITYLAASEIPDKEWALVASSPSAVPTHTLPALHDPASDRWIAGFEPIISHLKSLSPAYDLDGALTPAQRADTTAYASFVKAHVGPLLALSLYVSSANWAAATRPAYGRILPFPLTWTEPPALRATMAARAEHLGLSSLDTDSDGDQSDSPSLFDAIPQRLRRAPATTVSGALSPEQKAQIRLDAAADACLCVLADLLGNKSLLLSDGAAPSSLDCLAFGYLALAYFPLLPRPWLRNALASRFGSLVAYLNAVQARAFSNRSAPLPRTPHPAGTGALAVMVRLGWGAAGWAPGLPEEVHRFAIRRHKQAPEASVSEWGGDDTTCDPALASLLRLAIVLPCVVAVALPWILRPPRFGSPVYRYVPPRVGLGGLGAVGTMLGYLSSGGGGSSGGGRGFASDFEDVSIEVGGRAPIVEIDVNLDGLD